MLQNTHSQHDANDIMKCSLLNLDFVCFVNLLTSAHTKQLHLQSSNINEPQIHHLFHVNCSDLWINF